MSALTRSAAVFAVLFTGATSAATADGVVVAPPVRVVPAPVVVIPRPVIVPPAVVLPYPSAYVAPVARPRCRAGATVVRGPERTFVRAGRRCW